MENIRNFSIIAHVDHGKSTLADRLLEYTGSVEKRHLQERMLDRMELEQERGITIKMQPVSVAYTKDGETYTLNIIDTPGHIDFSYEVSRSLRAVEGALLLVDATQGVQAQTLSVLEMAQEQGLSIIPALSKIDMSHARVDEVSREVAELLGCTVEDICQVSGKTGEGVEQLLSALLKRIPAPKEEEQEQTTVSTARALVFDFSYTNHTGINAYARVYNGTFKKGERLTMQGAGQAFSLREVGVFTPDMVPKEAVSEGMIGYFTTGIKEPGVAVVGDTVTHTQTQAKPFLGYQEIKPVIWASLYPQEADECDQLERSLRQMRLTDAAFTYEEEQSTVFGKGFRCGFLGMLHLEIITERIRRESEVELVIASPSTDYAITKKNGEEVVVTTPARFRKKTTSSQLQNLG